MSILGKGEIILIVITILGIAILSTIFSVIRNMKNKAKKSDK